MSGGIMEPDVARKSGGGKKKDAGPYVHPAPEVNAREPQPGDPDVPAKFTALRKKASLNGWEVETKYARGWTHPGPLGQGAVVLKHSYALKMVRDGVRAVAIWSAPAVEGKVTWKFSYAGILGSWLHGVTPKAFPFTLSSIEVNALVVIPTDKRLVLLDQQFESISNDDKGEYFVSESDFRAHLKGE
jgi:hypothetical protein